MGRPIHCAWMRMVYVVEADAQVPELREAAVDLAAGRLGLRRIDPGPVFDEHGDVRAIMTRFVLRLSTGMMPLLGGCCRA